MKHKVYDIFYLSRKTFWLNAMAVNLSRTQTIMGFSKGQSIGRLCNFKSWRNYRTRNMKAQWLQPNRCKAFPVNRKRNWFQITNPAAGFLLRHSTTEKLNQLPKIKIFFFKEILKANQQYMHIHDFIPSPIPIHNPFHQFQKLNNIYLHQSDQIDSMSIFRYQSSVALLVSPIWS